MREVSCSEVGIVGIFCCESCCYSLEKIAEIL